MTQPMTPDGLSIPDDALESSTMPTDFAQAMRRTPRSWNALASRIDRIAEGAWNAQSGPVVHGKSGAGNDLGHGL